MHRKKSVLTACWNQSRARKVRWVYLLCVSVLMLGCSPPSDPAPPSCLVELGGPVQQLRAGQTPEADALARPGPHPVWSTQPHPSCAENPRIQANSSDTTIELLITYPAASNALESGYADVAPGKWPVILFAHANTYADCNLVDDYTTLHQRWASWGFIVVSVEASHLCEKNSKANLEGRRDDLMAAWASIVRMGQQPENRLYEHVDIEKLVLAGHSRGATAALLASQEIDEVDGLIWMQGVDTAGYQLGRPQVTVPALGIVAGLDRDIRFPKAEPTREQLSGPHAWATLSGGIHAFTADTIPARSKDTPALEREEQLEVSAQLSTLLLAAAVGVSNGATLVEVPGAHTRLFGPSLRQLHSALQVTWQRKSDRINWIEKFQLEWAPTADRSAPQVLPALSARRTLSWKPGETDGGKILGDSYALQMDAGSRVSFPIPAHPEAPGLEVTQGTLLAFLVKDLETGPMQVHVETRSGERVLAGLVEPTAPKDPARYFQVEIEIAPNADLELQQVILDLTAGHALIDDIRLVSP